LPYLTCAVASEVASHYVYVYDSIKISKMEKISEVENPFFNERAGRLRIRG